VATPKKEATVEELRDMLARSSMTVIADYRGLKVSDLQALRTTLRPLNGEARVAKNTLTSIAADQANQQGLKGYLAGPTILITAYGDPVSVAKAIGDFARTSRILKVRGGMAGQRTIDETALATIATLPSREVLLARVVGQMQAPIYGLVSVLSGTIRKFAYVLQARIDQLGGAPDGAEAEAPAGA
jgi:large subunit ribosomal protein L10